MIQAVTLVVLGQPAPQGSKRVFNGRLVEAAGNKLKKWRSAIAQECIASGQRGIISGAIKVEIDFYMPRPKTVKQSVRPLPIKPPDLDKLCRSVLDGIGQSECIWEDDSQVVELIARKYYADDQDSGARIVVTPI
jgi:crossover junction endodeoxyribonuclease RusA